MKAYRKGQAALEFLTTYGWAFLVILVAIGGLSYFGVFDLGRVLPDGCKFDNSLECGDVFTMSTDGANAAIQFEIRNGRDRAIQITGIEAVERGLADSAGGVVTCVADYSGAPISVSPGQYEAINFTSDVGYVPTTTGVTMAGQDTCGLVDNAGQKKTFDVEVTYTVAGSSISLVSNGEVTTTVTDNS